MKNKSKSFLALSVFLVVILIFFRVIYITDNKYTTSPPFAQGGTLVLNTADLNRDTPIFLIDGWEIYDGNITPSEFMSAANLPPKQLTYIGEFSNYGRGAFNKNPLGSATYRLIIDYSGNEEVVVIDFPELFSKYTIWLNGEVLQNGIGSAHISFSLKNGKNELLLNITSKNGYYSGMYFPAALGREQTVLNVERTKTGFYSFAFLCPLTLALFSLMLWNNKKNKMHRYFGLLCISFSLFLSYYFVQLWKLPFSENWYLIEDCAFYAICYFSLRLTIEAADFHEKKYTIPVTLVAIFFSITEVMLFLVTPYFSWAIFLHGKIQDIYRILVVLCLIVNCTRVFKINTMEKFFVLIGNAFLALGILVNLVNANLFEPIYSLWQFEWCGLFLVLLFGAMMVAQNKRILSENATYATRLESMVDERTQQLTYVLEERRQFFSDMAHDLKAPLAATKTFVGMIKRHSVGVDDELRYYIAQVESKQSEMSRRVQSLNELNAIDKITAQKEKISVNEFLNELYETHNPDVAVSEVHLNVQQGQEDSFIFMQREKLAVAFENLIYNALRVTPPNGSITISAQKQNHNIVFQVADTGCGIIESELPFIFNRFYIGENNQHNGGSGLGLYIVKNIIEEVGGGVSVTSKQSVGTVFTIYIPLYLSE